MFISPPCVPLYSTSSPSYQSPYRYVANFTLSWSSSSSTITSYSSQLLHSFASARKQTNITPNASIIRFYCHNLYADIQWSVDRIRVEWRTITFVCVRNVPLTLTTTWHRSFIHSLLLTRIPFFCINTLGIYIHTCESFILKYSGWDKEGLLSIENKDKGIPYLTK